MAAYYLAVDIGASSGRHIIGHMENGKMVRTKMKKDMIFKERLSENQIQISAQDIDFSTSAEETLICQYAGNAMSIGFKSTFLIDILNNLTAQEVIVELADPSRAGVIVPAEQEEKEDVLMLLMPMMLND